MELRCVYELDEGKNNEAVSCSDFKESGVESSGSAIGSGRKNGGPKENGHSILTSVSRIMSQIKKPPHRRSGSPINWFPRKKIDSYLKRKIKLLQENEGRNLSLDETLGNANPHYTRIAREKIAAREAARKAMEARKAAMVEASWCRILRAARIQCKEAQYKLDKAEKCAMEAFESARAKGVMMYDRPDNSPRRSCEIESSSIGGRSTHTVTASFETAFEVDKEVMAAVKKAFIQLANGPRSSNKEEFKDLLWKISQNPDHGETDSELSDTSSESEFNADCSGDDRFNVQGSENKQMSKSMELPSDHDKSSVKSFTTLVDDMLDRLKGLQEDELASLATIVATCGLNAALLKLEHCKDHEPTATDVTLLSNINQVKGARRNSSASRFLDGHMNRKEPVTDVPSLDKFLVKHVSRLEKEVQEARKSRCQQTSRGSVMDTASKSASLEPISDLGSILVKHVSKFEKEILAAKKCQEGNSVKETSLIVNEDEGKGLKTSQGLNENMQKPRVKTDRTVSLYQDKENIDSNTLFTQEKYQDRKSEEITNGTPSVAQVGLNQDHMKRSPVKTLSRLERAKLEALSSFSSQGHSSLDKILVKPVHRLEKDKMQVAEQGNEHEMQRDRQKHRADATAPESLDKILVKHVSRLEMDKLDFGTKYGQISAVKRRDQQDAKIESLDEILIKHQSKLEKAKLAASEQPAYDIIKQKKHETDATFSDSLDKILVRRQPELQKAKLVAAQQSEDYTKHVGARKEARERELQEAWGGLSLGNSMRPHLSRLERDRAAWKRAEDEERMRASEVSK